MVPGPIEGLTAVLPIMVIVFIILGVVWIVQFFRGTSPWQEKDRELQEKTHKLVEEQNLEIQVLQKSIGELRIKDKEREEEERRRILSIEQKKLEEEQKKLKEEQQKIRAHEQKKLKAEQEKIRAHEQKKREQEEHQRSIDRIRKKKART